MKSKDSLANQLSSWVDLSLPQFSRTVPLGTVRQLSFAAVDAFRWYDELKRRMTSRPGFLPLYRMSDGEFVFICGRRPAPISFFVDYPKIAVRTWARHLLRLGTDTFLSGSKGYGFEAYTPSEWEEARRNYASRLAALAKEGILAVNFVHHAEFPRQYIAPVCNWMDGNGVDLSADNYFPFYFVYALLLGPDAPLVYGGKRILVVTSDEDGTKAPAIAASLRAMGAANVRFTPISRSKSMFDRIDISSAGPIDLVLIGAGVGALNILEQVRSLGAVSIDAGFVLDCLWRPGDFIGRRAFTAPDPPLAALSPAGRS
jgi:hypothetical protein